MEEQRMGTICDTKCRFSQLGNMTRESQLDFAHPVYIRTCGGAKAEKTDRKGESTNFGEQKSVPKSIG